MKGETIIKTILKEMDRKLDAVVEGLTEVMGGRFDSLETRIGSVETRIGSVETRIGSVESQLKAVADSTAKFERMIPDLATKDDIRQLRREVMKREVEQDTNIRRLEKGQVVLASRITAVEAARGPRP